MKTNGNNLVPSDYYIGLDIGTNSVGWAVTDTAYNILRFKGNSMWGIRLFDEAMDASERRTARTARRRLARRKQRLLLLELLFNDEIRKKDENFFLRLKESSLWLEDRSVKTDKYSLFGDPGFSDKDYLKKYPSIYHLRSELIHSTEPHDIRLVYLALHHIIKSRGHFLFDGDTENGAGDFSASLDELFIYVADEYGSEAEFTDRGAFEKTLLSAEMNITAKKKAIKTCIKKQNEEEPQISLNALYDLLAGATVKLSELFCDEELKNADIKSVCLKDDIDETFDALSAVLDSRAELIIEAKKVFDIARLSQILGDQEYISDAKIALYKKNKAELARLKKYVRDTKPGEYKRIFNIKGEKLNNYAAYSGYKTKSGEYTCKQEDFCAFLKTTLGDMKNDPDMADIWAQIEGKNFLPKLKGSDNGVIPNQLHKIELKAILKNASSYLPFLNETDADGLTVADKILSIFEFRIPYYVGPLNKKAGHQWIIRTDEKIFPWNFEKVVDLEKSAQAFITELIGRCTYTGEYVIPADSLLYSEFSVLNEINPLKINGNPIPTEIKQRIYTELFVQSNSKVTKNGIKKWLVKNGLAEAKDEISGVDDTIKSKLKSLHDFRSILDRTGNKEAVEDMIRSILIFGDDKKMLKRWLKREYGFLTDDDIRYISRLKYKDWGRLSAEFLTGIYHTDENGEAVSIMEMLRNTNNTLMQLLSSDFRFRDAAEEYRKALFHGERSLTDQIEDLYLAPAVRRSLRQTLKIIDEIVDIRHGAPAKIFIEVAREQADKVKKERTESRKQKLIDLYKACKEDSGELFERLESEPEDRLRSDKLYLYYTQFGKCMYTGESIDLAALLSDNTHYDIDHIFPRSRVKDNSLDNRVLVKSTENREKTNDYPIKEEIRTKMYPFWKMLKEKNLISQKKFERLTRNVPLTEKELADFVARQVVETQQSTKAAAALIKEYYPTTRVVYSKAGNVSDFKQKFEFIKCREINDLHHAKDAYLNIVVGNVYDTKYTDRFFLNIGKEKYSLNKVFDYDVPGAWKVEETIKTVRHFMGKNNVLYTRMPHEVRGAISDLQILPAGKGQLEVKKGRDIEKYGGYNKLSGAYFCLVEHTVKKARIRTIEPVFIYRKALYEADPVRYCVSVLHLTDPVIIVGCIRIDSLLELNGMKLNITGRTGDRILFTHSYQLAVNKETEIYVKNIEKYLDRCDAQKKELPLTEWDGITETQNNELYEYFIKKCHANVYYPLFRNMVADMEACREKFAGLPIFSQCRVLREILKAFKCNRQNPNFELLNGKKSVGIILFSKSVNTQISAYLIDQSVTGLYEYKTDLLK